MPAAISPACAPAPMLTDDGFVVNGQKVWTSGAHDADFLLTFVRTDPDAREAPGHQRARHPDRHAGRDATAVRFDRRPATTSTSTRSSSTTSTSPPSTSIGELHDGLAGRHRRPRRGTGDALALAVRAARRCWSSTSPTTCAAPPIADDPLTLDWYGTAGDRRDGAAPPRLPHGRRDEPRESIRPSSRSSSCSAPRRRRTRAADALETFGPESRST